MHLIEIKSHSFLKWKLSTLELLYFEKIANLLYVVSTQAPLH